MSSKDKKKEDSRPAYVAPRVIRLDDVSTGIGVSCQGNGSGYTGDCLRGNGAKLSCGIGNGAATQAPPV